MNRERMLAVAVVVLALCAVFLAYRAFVLEPEVVRTRAFELVDENGQMRALLSISREGTVALGFFDKQGRVRSSVGLLSDGERVSVMKGSEGKTVSGAP